MSANISVAIALAGGFAMLLAASGSPFDPHQQLALVTALLSNRKEGTLNTTKVMSVQSKVVPPPADVVSLAWSNGLPVHS